MRESILLTIVSYSGADLSILVRDAAFMPVRLCQSAKYFLKIQEGNAIKYRPIEDNDVSRCNPNQIVQTTLINLKADELIVPDVSIVHPTSFFIICD